MINQSVEQMCSAGASWELPANRHRDPTSTWGQLDSQPFPKGGIQKMLKRGSRNWMMKD